MNGCVSYVLLPPTSHSPGNQLQKLDYYVDINDLTLSCRAIPFPPVSILIFLTQTSKSYSYIDFLAVFS